ncbi:MAG: hypothetical protein ACRDNJ_06585 [Solirubrobacteraceae bacterium]
MSPAGGGSSDRTTERHERALKIDPSLAAGDPVRVARAQNGAEAELLQALLLEVGVPSMLRRSPGFDVPDFLAAGPRDLLVPAAAVQIAREALHGAAAACGAEADRDAAIDGGAGSDGSAGPLVAPVRLLAGLLLALAIGALIIWGLLALVQ